MYFIMSEKMTIINDQQMCAWDPKGETTGFSP